jgi:hypothetical protein
MPCYNQRVYKSDKSPLWTEMRLGEFLYIMQVLKNEQFTDV